MNVNKMNVPFTAQEACYDDTRLDVLDNHLTSLIENEKLQCASYIMARNDKVFACHSMGKQDFRYDKECMPDNIRRIASVTKMFTAVAICKLVEDGVLRHNQAVSDFLEEFNTPLHKGITIFHLLTHTSGICSEGLLDPLPYHKPSWWSLMDSEEYNKNWVKCILSGPLHHKPGEQWSYSTAGYLILGEIIHKATGKKAEDYMMEKIFVPLGMNDTYFNVPKEKWDRLICTTEWNIPRDKDNNNDDDDIYIPQTGGGIYSTLNDLVIFGQMMLHKGTYNGVRIIGKKAFEYLTANHLKGIRNYCWGVNHEKSYGFGIEVVTEKDMDCGMSIGTFYHEGAGRSGLMIDPSENFVAAFYVPTNLEWVPESVINTKVIMWSGII